MKTYQGQCHCGAVAFQIKSETITRGMRCNCSICRRRNAVMSAGYFGPDDFVLLQGQDALVCYRFGDIMVNHYFCRHYGIYPFHDAIASPGTYRINLGCLDLDLEALDVRLFDGASTWQYLD